MIERVELIRDGGDSLGGGKSISVWMRDHG